MIWKIIKVVLIWAVAIVSIKLLNDYANTPETFWKAVCQDIVLLFIFFSIWGTRVDVNATFPVKYDKVDIYSMPAGVLIGYGITLALPMDAASGINEIVILFVYLLCIYFVIWAIEHVIRESVLNPDGGIKDITRIACQSFFWIIAATTVSLCIYVRHVDFFNVGQFEPVYKFGSFILRDSFEWIVENV